MKIVVVESLWLELSTQEQEISSVASLPSSTFREDPWVLDTENNSSNSEEKKLGCELFFPRANGKGLFPWLLLLLTCIEVDSRL